MRYTQGGRWVVYQGGVYRAIPTRVYIPGYTYPGMCTLLCYPCMCTLLCYPVYMGCPCYPVYMGCPCYPVLYSLPERCLSCPKGVFPARLLVGFKPV